MKQGIMRVAENAPLAKNTWKMKLVGDQSATVRPGQFINIALDGFYLRRPISVSALRGEELTIYYKLVGRGTEAMSRLLPGAELDVLSGLGNGFDLSRCGQRPALIGGGAGVAPLYWLAEELVRAGKKPSVLLGFGSRDEVFLKEEFEALDLPVFVTTVDGSFGVKGFVTAALPRMDAAPDYVYTCGPEPMMKAVYAAADCPGQYSFEERMGCGFGACMGCSCQTKGGAKRICRDGPVLDKEEILW